MPEVSLVAVLDADKEGYLRSETSLIQIFGRAARNLNGHVILYADQITNSMERATVRLAEEIHSWNIIKKIILHLNNKEEYRYEYVINF